MPKSHHFLICRAIYNTARQHGSPAVYITKLAPNHFCGETAGGDILIEEISGCCKWAIKAKIAEEWLAKYKK